MSGSLQIKKNYYYVVVNIYVDGKRKKKWISTGIKAVKGNKHLAEHKLIEILAKMDKAESLLHSPPSEAKKSEDLLFAETIKLWLESVRKTVDEVTYQGYKVQATSHVIPYFEKTGVLLCDVDSDCIQEFIDFMCESGKSDGSGGLSANSVKHLKNVVSLALKYALMKKWIAVNPCVGIVMPKIESIEYKYYNAEQIKMMLDTLKDEPLYPLIKMTVVYGLRRSEVLGLKWDAIDFSEKTVVIKRTVSRVTSVVEKEKTKNKSSKRSFPLIPEIEEMLFQIKKETEKNKILFGKEYVDSGYLFVKPDGTPYLPNYVTDKFSELLKKNNLPKIRFHDLRHSCASFLINKGFNLKDVQEWLGHSDIKVTADIYSHLEWKRKQEMADKIGSSIQ